MEKTTEPLASRIDGWVRGVAAKLGSAVEARGDAEWRIAIAGVPVSIRYLEGEDALRFVVRFVPVPAARRAEFFHMLLVRNLSVKFGAYAILADDVVFCDALATRDLDASEFLATLHSIADEVRYTLDFLRTFGGKAAPADGFEGKIGAFTFSDDPGKRAEAIEMLLFAVGHDGVRHFLKSYEDLEGKPYLPAERVAALLK